MPTRRDVRNAILSAYREHGAALGKDVTDEMGIPSYLQRGLVSRLVFWPKLKVVIRLARLRPDSRVFDFGCGSGILLAHLSDQGRFLQATDLHAEVALSVAERLGLKRVEFLPADSWQDSIPNGGVDTIIAANVLEHMKDRREVLQMFSRKLARTGRLVVSGPTENQLYRFGRRLIGFSGHYHVTTIDHILEEARAVGLRRLQQRNWPVPGPMCLYRIVSFGPPRCVERKENGREGATAAV